jgi:hypothetical protein
VTNNSKFKEWALVSGYPIENDVLEILENTKDKIQITRNIEFEAKNEDEELTTRSLDFHVTIQKDSRNIPNQLWKRGPHKKIELKIFIGAKYISRR